MPWTVNDFPDAFNNFDPEVRHRLLEIATELIIEQEFEESRAIADAISRIKELEEFQGTDFTQADKRYTSRGDKTNDMDRK